MDDEPEEKYARQIALAILVTFIVGGWCLAFLLAFIAYTHYMD